ncbi:MAG: ComF family protein [Clostridiales bacterium]|jgi:competence protein ComFC|nr:ComF family protein [Clostridiales bacterium]
MKIKALFQKIVAPEGHTCMVCGDDLVYESPYALCRGCDLVYNDGNRCVHCGRALHGEGHVCNGCKTYKCAFAEARSALVYEGNSRVVVRRFKFRAQPHLARPLAELMVSALVTTAWIADALVYVPMTKKAEYNRGYNQSRLLAEEIEKLTDLPVLPALRVIGDKKVQSALSAAARWKAVAGVFGTADIDLKGKRLILIDDILTTGATADACATALKKAGAKTVYLLTIASTADKKMV